VIIQILYSRCERRFFAAAASNLFSRSVRHGAAHATKYMHIQLNARMKNPKQKS
jgi:hypothetical protein